MSRKPAEINNKFQRNYDQSLRQKFFWSLRLKQSTRQKQPTIFRRITSGIWDKKSWNLRQTFQNFAKDKFSVDTQAKFYTIEDKTICIRSAFQGLWSSVLFENLIKLLKVFLNYPLTSYVKYNKVICLAYSKIFKGFYNFYNGLTLPLDLNSTNILQVNCPILPFLKHFYPAKKR